MASVHFDFETFSECDLKKKGVSNYARHPSTEVLMVAWTEDRERYRQWDITQRRSELERFLDLVRDERNTLFAWNSGFEWNILEHTLGVHTEVDRYVDPMVMARHMALPGSLAQIGPVIGLDEDLWKHATGKALINFFCGPRKPTKRDLRTRNHPDDNDKTREKWKTFLEYNVQDVKAEVAAYDWLRRWDMPDEEWDMWFEDRRINERGVPVSLEAIDNAVRLVDDITADRIERMKELTRLANPNSGEQLLGWLKDRDYPFNDLKIGHVRRALEEAVKDGDEGTVYHEVLKYRTEISKASVKKFTAYQNASCGDALLRNMMMFAGAGRTSRWSGSLVQLHNLARPTKDFEKAEAQIELARNIRRMSREMFEFVYREPMEALSSGSRGVIVAPDGMLLYDADLNAIENRVLGYMAGEERILDVFKHGRDPYVDFATYMFDEPYDKLFAEYKAGDKSKRTTAKPGVLGCFTADTLVLTNRGWVRIADVRAFDMVHDGDTWVRHGGVAYRGKRDVIDIGLEVTHDHEFEIAPGVWRAACLLEQEPSVFLQALDSADGRLAISQDRPEAQGHATSAFANVVSYNAYLDQISLGASQRCVPGVRQPREGMISGKLLDRRFSIFSPIVSTQQSRGVVTRLIRTFRTTDGAEFVRGSRTLTPGSIISSTISEPMEPSKSIESTTTGTMNGETFVSPLARSKTRIRDTWDVIDAGPNRRYVVLSKYGPLIAHNCGYMLGEGYEYEDEDTGEILATGLLGYAWNMGIRSFTQEQSSKSVKVWRETFSKCVDFWYNVSNAVFKCIRTKRRTYEGPFEFEMDGPWLKARLPSGRYLYYFRPRIMDWKKPWGDVGPTITYEGTDSKSQRKGWTRIATHPGKTTENLDQAIARDILRDCIMRARREGLDIRLHVHDQIVGIASEKDAHEHAKILEQVMSEPMRWAPDLPLKAEAEVSKIWVKT